MTSQAPDKFNAANAFWVGLGKIGLTPAAVLRQARLPVTLYDGEKNFVTREGRAKISVTVVDPQHPNRILIRMPLRTLVRSGETFETYIAVLDEKQAADELRLNTQALQLEKSVARTRESFDSLADNFRHFRSNIDEAYRSLRQIERIEEIESRPQFAAAMRFNREFLDELSKALAEYPFDSESRDQLSQLARRLDEISPRTDDLREMEKWHREMSYFPREIDRKIGSDLLDQILEKIRHRMELPYGGELKCKSCGLNFLDDWFISRRWWPYWRFYPYPFFWRECPRCGAELPWLVITPDREQLARFLDNLRLVSRDLTRLCDERTERHHAKRGTETARCLC